VAKDSACVADLLMEQLTIEKSSVLAQAKMNISSK
jgi:hypothetical protein